MNKLKNRLVQLDANGPCPCGQGRKLQVCCLKSDGKLQRKLGCLTPPGANTGYSHPKCYLQRTNNCCEKLSAEHYISKAVLAEIDNTFDMPFPWLADGEVVRIGINAMTAKILCKRHNSALAELDTHAREFFRFIRLSIEYVTGETKFKSPPVFLVSGDAIELWATKMLLGLYHAKIASHQREILRNRYSVDIELFCSALANPGMTAPTGLYVVAGTGKFEGEFHVSPLSISDDERVIGIQFRFGLVTMDCVLDPRDVNFTYLKEHYFYRPSAIHINSKNRGATILMSWLDGVERKSVDLELGSYERVFK